MTPTQVSSLLKALLDSESRWVPPELEYHPGVVCPMSCIFCHTKLEPATTNLYIKHHLREPLPSSFDEKIITDYSKLGGKKLIISGGLEPFTTEKTVRAVEMAKKCQLDVSAYTNGLPSLLQRENVRRVLVSSCKQIRISLHAATPQIFQRIQMPTSSEVIATKCFNIILQNIQGLIAERDDSPLSSCRIGISFLVLPYNVHEVGSILELAELLRLDFLDFRSDILSDCGLSPMYGGIGTDSFLEKVKAYSNRIEIDFRRPLVRRELPQPKACYAPLRRIVVNPIGEVYACCLTAQSTAYPNAFLGKVKKGLDLDGILRKVCRKVPIIPYCKVCPDREFLFNTWMNRKIEAYGFPTSSLTDGEFYG